MAPPLRAVGFYSPLPPARTGVADYAAALLQELRKLGAIEVNQAGDVSLYHIGNNQLHHQIYQRALVHPGVTVIHDAVLHHYFLGSLNEQEYVNEFTFNYGSWMEHFARELWRNRARSGTDPRYFRYPMLKRIAEASRSVIVHNPAASAIVRAHFPAARVTQIPHLFEMPSLPSTESVQSLRTQLGCGPNTLLCGVFGHLRGSKRLTAVLRAFARARETADMMLLVAGQFVSSDLERSAEPLLTQPGIVRKGYLPDEDFWRHAAAVDLCINLRYPPAGESSGIAIRLMGIGKPVILSGGRETSSFPPGTFLPADTGESEEDELAAYLLWLASDAASRDSIGARAAAYIREEHSLARVGQMYWNVLRDCYDSG